MRWVQERTADPLKCAWLCRLGLDDRLPLPWAMALREAGCAGVTFLVTPGDRGTVTTPGSAPVELDRAVARLRQGHLAGLDVSLELVLPAPGLAPRAGGRGEDALDGLLELIARQQGCAGRVVRLVLDGPDSPLLDGTLDRLLDALDRARMPVGAMRGAGATQGRRARVSRWSAAVIDGCRHRQIVESGQGWLALDTLRRRLEFFGGERALLSPAGLRLGVLVRGRWLDAAWGRWRCLPGQDGGLDLECALPGEALRLLLTVRPASAGGMRLGLAVRVERRVAPTAVEVTLPAAGDDAALVGLVREVRPPPRRLRHPGQALILSWPGWDSGTAAPGTHALIRSLTLAPPPHPSSTVREFRWGFGENGASVARRDDESVLEVLEGRRGGATWPAASRAGETPSGLRIGRTRRVLAAHSRTGPPEDDFALVICPPWETQGPPLWLAMLAAQLRADGLRGTCHDVNNQLFRQVDRGTRALWQMSEFFAWQQREPFERVRRRLKGPLDAAARRVLSRRPRVVGFSVTQANLRATMHMVQRVKAHDPSVKTVLGGPGMFWTKMTDRGEVPSAFEDYWSGDTLDPDGLVDVVVRGEADLTVAPLVRTLEGGGDPLGVPGTVMQRDGHWWSTPPQSPTDLDALAISDFSDLDLSSFSPLIAPMVTSRGCLRTCGFCNDWRIQGKYRRRSADHIFREMVYMTRRYEVRYFVMNDLLLNGDLTELDRLCDLLLAAGLHTGWGGQAIVDPRMDRALLRKMARAGCRDLTYGVESFSQDTVDAMGKCFDVRDALLVLERTREAGICPAINLLVGFPGESEEGFEMTVQTLRSASRHIGRVQAINTCHITPRSSLWYAPERYGMCTDMPEPWFRWTGPLGNTYDVRKERLRRLVAHAGALGLAPSERNLYDEYLLPGVNPQGE